MMWNYNSTNLGWIPFFFHFVWSPSSFGLTTHWFLGEDLFIFFFLVFTYFWYEKGCHHEIPPRVPPSLATPLMVWSSNMKFWQQFEIHKLFVCAKFHGIKSRNFRFRTRKRVLLSMSRRFIFGSSAICVWACVYSLLLSDLSYSPDLALTLMSGRMRGARARARSYTSRRDSEIKLTAHT